MKVISNILPALLLVKFVALAAENEEKFLGLVDQSQAYKMQGVRNLEEEELPIGDGNQSSSGDVVEPPAA